MACSGCLHNISKVPKSRPGPPKPLIQLFLNASSDGKLTLGLRSMPDQSTNDDSHKEVVPVGLITRLPEEILNQIFGAAIAIKRSNDPEYYRCALALSRVCRLFHRIVQPLLFQHLEFLMAQHELAPACNVIRNLHRTLQENPLLGLWCTRADFRVRNHRGPSFRDFILADELIGWLSNITTFSFHGGFAHQSHPQTWPFLKRALERIPRIKNITISSEDSGLILAPICDIIQTMQLESLNLGCISARSDRASWIPKCVVVERTSTISSLSISNFGETPEALQHLLRLPRALQHFKFINIEYTSINWDFSIFPELLYNHRTSLKSIEINLFSTSSQDANFLPFTELETLKLSPTELECSPVTACDNFLAPKLKRFIWNLTEYNLKSGRWSDFGPHQRDWIIAFAQLAIERKTTLTNIDIIFTPDERCYPTTREQLRDWPNPWDFMDEARDAIAPDIELSYNKCWGRQECIKQIEKVEREKMEELERLDGNQDIRKVRRSTGYATWLRPMGRCR